jgi:hypothetical protein
MNPAYLSAGLASATIPEGLIIQPLQAWAVILTALVVCCGCLWFLTRRVAAVAPDDRAHDAARSGRRRSRHADQTRRPALQPLAHHGSRAA